MGKLPYKIIYDDKSYKIYYDSYSTISEYISGLTQENIDCSEKNICMPGPHGFYIEGYYISDHIIKITNFWAMTQ